MEIDDNTSWFHCGRCGTLFRAVPGENDERMCTSCGGNPSLGLEPPPAATLPPAPVFVDDSAEVTHDPSSRHKHGTRRRSKHNGLMTKLVLAWSLVLVAIVFGTRWLLHDPADDRRPTTQQTAEEALVSEEDELLLREAGPLCNQTFFQFLAADTPEQRTQFVADPTAKAARMVRFYGATPAAKIDPQQLTLAARAIVHLPDGRGIETRWRNADGRVFDAVFVERNNEWRLDWDQFVRFSDLPWSVFLAGSGADHGEFRLLARERLAEERKEKAQISLILYAPVFGKPQEQGYSSPEFLVPRDSDDGRLLEAAFALQKSGKRPFGVDLPNNNPEDHIRVRVKVRRVQQELTRTFELEKIIAPHWYDTDAPGIDLPAVVPAAD